MATAQEMAQAAQTVIANNGNPNTVYNNNLQEIPRSPWTTNLVSPAANFTPTAAPSIQAKRADYAGGGWVAPSAAPVSQDLARYTRPNTDPNVAQYSWTGTQGPQPGTGGGGTTIIDNGTGGGGNTQTPAPVDTTGWQWIVKDGKGVPGKNNDLYANDPVYKRAYDEVVAHHQGEFKKNFTKDSDASKLSSHVQELYNKYKGAASAPSTGGTQIQTGTGSWTTGGIGSNMPATDVQGQLNSLIQGGVPVIDGNRGWASVAGSTSDPGKVSEAVGNVVNNFTETLKNVGTGMKADGVMKFLDAVTEPFMPGNMYMSELGAVNWANVAKSVMNHVIPGVGTLASKIIDAIPDGAPTFLLKLRDFIRQGKFQDAANEIYKELDAEKQAALAQQAFTGTGTGGGMGDVGGGGIQHGWLGGGFGGGGGGHGLAPIITVGEVKNAE